MALEIHFFTQYHNVMYTHSNTHAHVQKNRMKSYEIRKCKPTIILYLACMQPSTSFMHLYYLITSGIPRQRRRSLLRMNMIMSLYSTGERWPKHYTVVIILCSYTQHADMLVCCVYCPHF